jgi:hypothetical protein
MVWPARGQVRGGVLDGGCEQDSPENGVAGESHRQCDMGPIWASNEDGLVDHVACGIADPIRKFIGVAGL